MAGFSLHVHGESGALTSSRVQELLDHIVSTDGVGTEDPLTLNLVDSLPDRELGECLWQDEGMRCHRVSSLLRLESEAAILETDPKGDQTRMVVGSAFDDEPVFGQLTLLGFGFLAQLRQRGLFDLHGGAVVSPKGCGLLILGESGSGKSTTTLQLCQHGFSYGSDDVLLLDSRVHDHLQVFPFRKSLGFGPEPKRLVAPESLGLSCHRGVLGPSALIFPRIVDQEPTTMDAIPARNACLSVMQCLGGLLLNPDLASRQMEAASFLVGTIPCFRLNLGRRARRNVEDAPEVITTTLRKVGLDL